MSDLPLLEFNPKLPKLSKSERKVLDLLVEAGKLIVPIYEEQLKQTSFDKKEVEKAAKKNPQILSPFTLIEKINNKLVATSYHVKYAKLLKPVAEKLEQAAEISENKDFGKYLRLRAKALIIGSYELLVASRLEMKPYILDISIGPLHHYDDRLPFSKASYHAWVGVVEKEGTNRLYNYKSVTLSAIRKASLPRERIDLDSSRIKAKVLDVV
ncbi:MAG: hypothetical protein Q8Q91_01495, partial [Candidatus Daviesbacteria bacterium]|nr:hypothetical protein [Candidatus Daviesbacteria bacterium]